jgi:beta-lactam-binding protein with PASTA domain
MYRQVCVSRTYEAARKFGAMRLRRRPARRTRIDEGAAGPPVVEEERYVPPRRPPIPELWPWLLLLLLLVIGGLLAAYFLTRDNNHDKSASAVTVPAVVGLKQDKAVRRLNDRELVPQLVTQPSKFPAGTVFAQDPGAGTQVDRRSRVRLSVSATALTGVPNVVGSKTTAAVARLQAAGLQAQVTTVPARAAPGVVVKESPAAGTKVAKGSTVSLRVSKGQTTVPDVTGRPASDAKAALRTAGLVPVEFKVPGVESKGTVTAQKPLPNKKVPRGSKVRINVSTGAGSSGGTTTSGTTTPSASQTVKVPNVVGLQQSAAQRRLHASGLGTRVRYVTTQRPAGQVVAQSPGVGTSVHKGSKVQISVSLGPNATTAPVPDLVGQDQQTAKSTLQNAGFEVQVIVVPPPDPSQSGLVVDEQPSGGTPAPEGSTVTIYVGSG